MISSIVKFSSIRDGSVKDLSIEEIYKNFGRVLVLCLDTTNKTKGIGQFEALNYKLIPMPVSIIKNTFIKNFLHLLDYEYLNSEYNIDRKFFSCVDQKELVLNLSNISSQDFESFNMQFNGVCNFKDYLVATLLDDYMAYSSTNEVMRTNRINMLQTMNERSYWSLYSNCRLNISLQFMQRGFNLHLTQRLENDQIKGIIEKINKYSVEDDNYLNYLYRKQTYVDAASNLKEKGYKLYRITTNPICSSMEIDTFNKFLNENIYMSDKEYYFLVMNLLSSKELCHLVINNQALLLKLKTSGFYSKYYHVFKYLLGYAWITMYLEESIKKKNIVGTDRFIFDIETACLLPETPGTKEDILKSSAYLPVLVSSQLYNLNDNIMGVEPRIREQIRYGIADKNTFMFRLSKFLTGTNNFKLFEGLDWSNIAVSGSLIACCLPNFNPLMLNFMTKAEITSNSDKFVNYINEYYRDADIDMLCNLEGSAFINKVYYVANTIETNIKQFIESTKITGYEKDLLVTVKPVKTVAVIINTDFIKKYLLAELEAQGMTYGEIVLDINNIKIKKAVYPLYLKYKKQKNLEFKSDPTNSEIWTNEIYAPEFDIVGVEQLQIVFARTKKDKADEAAEQAKTNESKEDETLETTDDLVAEEDKEFDAVETKPDSNSKTKEEDEELPSLINEANVLFIINENLKYKIASPFMPHSIEAFKIRFNDYFGTVGSFHLPIVRAYYDGSTVKMTPSCISACMTMINIDYKYFAGSKDPIEIINKYRCRGFGTILNDKEKVRFFEYNNLVDKWKNIYSIKLNDSLAIKKCLGFKSPEDSMFKYSTKVYGDITNYIGIPSDASISTDRIIENIYGSKTSAIMAGVCKSRKIINEYGYIEPLQHFIIDMAWNLSLDK